ncbi:MAG: sugar ABC transporter substrate-binding protein [Candidatus Levybacteria bacterium]|nr:sugar ABC transporter substrate-binding protein [Candidatus Levybacteria bacterium]
MDDNTIFSRKQNNGVSSSPEVQPPPQNPPLPNQPQAQSGQEFTGEFVIAPSPSAQSEPVQAQKQADNPSQQKSFLSAKPDFSTSGASIFKPGQQSSSNGKHSSFLPSLIIKTLLGIVVVIAIAFFLLRFAPSFFSNVTKTKSENVTLTYWGLWEDAGVMQSITSDFQRQNPTIKISYEKKDIKQYRESLVTRIQNGSGPDIFRFHNTWLPQLANVLLPLSTDAIRKDDFKKWFYPVMQTDLTRSGAIYGIPLQVDTLSLFVNTDALQAAGVQPPTTWEDFTKTARILTVKNQDGKIQTAGAAMGTFDNITHAPDIISLLLVQNGANINDLSSTSKNASDSLDFYTSFAKGDATVWDDTLDPSYLAFAKGNLAMYFGYSWDVFTIKAINPQLNFQVVSVPHLQDRTMTIASYWSEGVSVKSKHQKEAMLFMKFLSQKDVAQRLYVEEAKKRLFGEPYARVDLADLLKTNALVYPFVSQAKDARSSFFAGNTFDNGLNEQMNGYLGNAVRSILSNTSPQSAVDTLAKGVNQILSRY